MRVEIPLQTHTFRKNPSIPCQVTFLSPLMVVTLQCTLLFRHNGHSNFAVHNKDENDLTTRLSLAMFSNYLIENAFLETDDVCRTKSGITHFSPAFIMQTIQVNQAGLLCKSAEL
jgi:hypothetical protein